MTSASSIPTPTSYAEGILKAWVAGDWGKLDEELDRGAALPHSAGNGWEEERVDLVNTVAPRLKALLHTGSRSFQDVHLRVCVNLLRSLIVPETVQADLAAPKGVRRL